MAVKRKGRAKQSAPIAAPQLRPAQPQDVDQLRAQLTRKIGDLAVAWWDFAAAVDPSNPTARAVSEVLRAIAVATDSLMVGVDQRTKFSGLARAWLRRTAREARPSLGLPSDQKELVAGRQWLEDIIGDGDEADASLVVALISNYPGGALRRYAPRLPAHQTAVNSSGVLGSQVSARADRECTALVHQEFINCRAEFGWDSLPEAQRKRKLVIAAFKALGHKKASNIYANENMTKTRASKLKRKRLQQQRQDKPRSR